MEISIDRTLKVYNKGKPLIFKTPIINIPFGLEKNYNNLIVKLELPKNKIFSNMILSLEHKFCELLNIEEITSQLRPSKNMNFGDLLTTKIIKYKDKTDIDIDRNEKMDTLSSLKKGDKGVATIEIDKLWKYNEKYTYKIKLKSLALL